MDRSSFYNNAACFGLSYVAYCYESDWTSDTLTSIGAGILTGLVFYFLSNLRNNKIYKIRKDIEILEPIEKEFQNIFSSSLVCNGS